MTITLNIVFLTVSIVTLIFVIMKVRKSQLAIVDAIAWILGAILLILISLFSGIVIKFANFLGFYSASNFILALFIFFLLLIVFMQNIKISMLNDKVKNLNHYLALEEKKKEDRE